ncbi:MAG: amidohydrolase family protein [Acidobacteriota bacterium]|nr:amidohydrolase family protein [Acidobacteriota bacterium]
MNRRSFLQRASAASMLPATRPLSALLKPLSSHPPIVDTHIHLYDPTRPGGVPWPEKDDTVLYRPALPSRYASLAEPHGIVGAIAVECSPLPGDNQWLLQTAAGSPWIVGVIGDLDPALAEFPAQLEQLQKEPLFRGIRYGNLWGRSLTAGLQQPRFVENLRLLARTGLVLESANPNPTLVRELLTTVHLVPELRIVLDHLPQAPPPQQAEARQQYLADLRSLAQHRAFYVKGSEIPRRIDGGIPLTLAPYRAWLDTIWEIVGEERMLFGSDWPNSDHMVPFDATLALAESYQQTRTAAARAAYYAKNSIAAYDWKPRTSAQAALFA